ncbi:hypothetical protein EYF80_013244 [Liparis tanakae]|uniref:Uncharacterized protein n=1 Tax=Liparis tanakae TaxID=230148 RepID=A0A4Z2IGM9_9TELE|nr:hypothetical protein EYF80_013244 [Liparis tanakae]
MQAQSLQVPQFSMSCPVRIGGFETSSDVREREGKGEMEGERREKKRGDGAQEIRRDRDATRCVRIPSWDLCTLTALAVRIFSVAMLHD